MTDQKRMTSVISKDFCTVYEIKKEDFLRIIKMNPEDYVLKIQNKLIKIKTFRKYFAACETKSNYIKISKFSKKNVIFVSINFILQVNAIKFVFYQIEIF